MENNIIQLNSQASVSLVSQQLTHQPTEDPSLLNPSMRNHKSETREFRERLDKPLAKLRKQGLLPFILLLARAHGSGIQVEAV